ncbi:MAG TPA: hypothetical protein VMF91_19955 [Bryobacteraceae bacterium]|nr:hypothetical protein [Bryobacteraceae bacterium]
MTRNLKVLSFDPVKFAPYPGFTYLFDNPAVDRRPGHRGVELLNADLADPRHALYAALHQFVAGVFTAEEIRQFKFCPLDPTTYHVTACDGMTVSVMKELGDSSRLDVAERLARDYGAMESLELLRRLAPPFEAQPSESGVCFRFRDLAVVNRDGAALVAVLQPADANASRFFEVLRAERCRISTAFGLQPSAGPEAHVSLGYFFDSELGGLFENEIPRLRVDSLQAAAISFYSISLYWFADMQTFWRAT